MFGGLLSVFREFSMESFLLMRRIFQYFLNYNVPCVELDSAVIQSNGFFQQAWILVASLFFPLWVTSATKVTSRIPEEWILSPGAGYDDSTAGQEKEDDAVFPGGYYKYVWDISAKDGPTSSDPECLTYSYSSQVDTVQDVNSGLIGALLICKSSQWAAEWAAAFITCCLLFIKQLTLCWNVTVGKPFFCPNVSHLLTKFL